MKKNLMIPHYSPLQDHPTGTIVTNSSSTVPSGYLPCDGRFLSSNDYPILFLMIRTTYGGDATSFALPYLESTDGSAIFYLIKI
jgi:microcystin-dependent protein